MNYKKNIFKTACKYKNKKVKYNGIVFDSQKEFNRFLVLSSMLANGEIRILERQVKFEIVKRTKFRPVYYVADFVYEKKKGNEWEKVVEDTKSDFTRRHPLYILKRKLMLAVHGIEVQES